MIASFLNLASFLDSLEFPAAVFDKESMTVIAVNVGATMNFGSEAEFLVGRLVAEFMIPEDRARLVESAKSSSDQQATIASTDGRRYGLRLMVESATWNGRPAGLAVLCDTDEGPSWGHPVSIEQGRVAAAVLQSALEAIIVIGERGVIQSTNSAADLMFGYANDDLIGRSVEVLMPRSVALRHASFVQGAVHKGISQPGRPRLFRGVRRDGREFDTAVSLTEIVGDPILFCAVIRDVTGDRLEQQRLEQIALTDQITGLANRRSFDDWWEEFSGLQMPVAVLLVELQRISVLVEGFGRQIADEVLSVIGGRIEEAASIAGARVARSDSGRFLVLNPDQHGGGIEQLAIETEMLARKLHDAVEGEIEASGLLFQPVLNIGIALRRETENDSASAIAEASVALANLNRMGVGLTSFGDASAQSRAAMELTMESALRRALQARDLIAAMQPIYRVADTSIIGAEMLARWTWEGHEIPPTTFVSLAERTGLIGELSRQMRGIALRYLPQFIAAADGGPWCTWLNVSPRELIETSFSAKLLADIEVAGIDPARVGLEVTETALLTNPKTAANTLRELRREGVSIALDDFGTGYSSLSLLKDIEVDAVKIDRSFTSALPTDRRVAAIVAGIIASTTAMGAEVIAEGVETVQQFEWLAEFGCHSAQGFLFTGVMAPNQLLKLMRPSL